MWSIYDLKFSRQCEFKLICGFLRLVIFWLYTNVSENMLPPATVFSPANEQPRREFQNPLCTKLNHQKALK